MVEPLRGVNTDHGPPPRRECVYSNNIDANEPYDVVVEIEGRGLTIYSPDCGRDATVTFTAWGGKVKSALPPASIDSLIDSIILPGDSVPTCDL
ncbi:hypothetical protein Pmani_040138 [Petrolisthes manimaculis]|uniref:Uncharacterized protein n=1 Tax=Petrolisthes manimaculis TaxID=1843537 RepID=A0AAE1TIP8_9EUCA|nr:hypothetical protein Pmani_040138 [Petrolisthes manimaculis]